MTETSELISGFARKYTVSLPTTDPAAPLGDLDSLLDIIGDARVVAVGENNHHVREFGLPHELDAMTWGSTLAGMIFSRDVRMASTVRWRLDQRGPDARIVTLVHNGHTRRVPFTRTTGRIRCDRHAGRTPRRLKASGGGDRAGPPAHDRHHTEMMIKNRLNPGSRRPRRPPHGRNPS